MPKLRVHNLTISLDGYAAGPNQRLDAPFGDGGAGDMHEWMFATRTLGGPNGVGGVDDQAIIDSKTNIGATIMGRNMFGPIRGPWPNDEWHGWWGDEPPFHHDVFVLTHHPRETLPMKGGTRFHFTADPIESVLQQAFAVANGEDVMVQGGAATVRQFLRAGLVDELHVVIVPMLVGGGERLLDNLGDATSTYQVSRMASSDAATHAWLTRR
jgi:dihydrofolate reductase